MVRINVITILLRKRVILSQVACPAFEKEVIIMIIQGSRGTQKGEQGKVYSPKIPIQADTQKR